MLGATAAAKPAKPAEPAELAEVRRSLRGRLLDPEPLHEGLSSCRRAHAEAQEVLRAAEQELQRSRVVLEQRRLPAARERVETLRREARCEEAAGSSAARLSYILERLDDAERGQREAEAACERDLRRVAATAAALAEAQRQCGLASVVVAAAQAELAAFQAREDSADKAEVIPYVDLVRAVSRWPDLQGNLSVRLMLLVGGQEWPLDDAVDLAREALRSNADRALFEVDEFPALVIITRSVANVVLRPSAAPAFTAFDILREVLSESSEVKISEAVKSAVRGPSGIGCRQETAVPACFKGELRRYQLEGFQWLAQNQVNGFGSLLADDMGLGKTIQTICLLCHVIEDKLLHGPALIIAPMSLLQNWRREVAKWAPSLRVYEYAGAGRVWPARADVVLASYGVVRSGKKKYTIGRIGAIILDEAQTVKNHSSEVSRVCKALAATCIGPKICLTGTPVENRLEEIHSILEVVLPGYLGSLADFRRRFIPRKREPQSDCCARLRRVIDPFMLRRLKSDPAICPELPPKVDLRHDVSLAPKQEQLYKNVCQHFMGSIAVAGRQGRAAQIFAMIHGLRKVCNHPATYEHEHLGLAERIGPSPQESGKTEVFLSLLRELLAQGEKCLVFVHYLNAIALLQKIVAQVCGVEAVAFTGALKAQERDDMANRFQNDPECKVCLATLGAGGVGLNLTAASHVVHYDRCYNPAVEDQASDRAHRIGQRSTVMVHRLIAQNTFEERIDSIMRKKQELREISGTGGTATWLADFGDTDLRQLFAYGPTKAAAPSAGRATADDAITLSRGASWGVALPGCGSPRVQATDHSSQRAARPLQASLPRDDSPRVPAAGSRPEAARSLPSDREVPSSGLGVEAPRASGAMQASSPQPARPMSPSLQSPPLCVDWQGWPEAPVPVQTSHEQPLTGVPPLALRARLAARGGISAALLAGGGPLASENAPLDGTMLAPAVVELCACPKGRGVCAGGVCEVETEEEPSTSDCDEDAEKQTGGAVGSLAGFSHSAVSSLVCPPSAADVIDLIADCTEDEAACPSPPRLEHRRLLAASRPGASGSRSLLEAAPGAAKRRRYAPAAFWAGGC